MPILYNDFIQGFEGIHKAFSSNFYFYANFYS